MSNSKPLGMEFPPWPCVYVVAASKGPVKIGYTTSMYRRFRELQHAAPSQLRVLATMPGDRDLEAWFHQRFARHRVHGEWFHLYGQNRAQLLRLMSGEVEVPKHRVEKIAERRATGKSERKRRGANKRWRGLAPSTGQRANSSVRRSWVAPTPNPTAGCIGEIGSSTPPAAPAP